MHTFPFPARINGKSIEDHGETGEATEGGLGLRLKIRDQPIKAFHGSVLNGFKEKLLVTLNQTHEK